MNRFYVATLIGVVVTMLLASRVIVLRASRSASPGLLARLRFDLDWILRGARNGIDDWIAASIARRERAAAGSMLQDRCECESSDVHFDPGCIDESCFREDCLARMSDRSTVRAIGETRP